ncbi:MAG: LysO family transporter [Fusobacteriaceae bacterium]
MGIFIYVIILALGFFLAKKNFIHENIIKKSSHLFNICLYILLGGLGYKIGINDKIVSNIYKIGARSFLIAFFAILGSLLMTFVFFRIVGKKGGKK